MRKISLLFFVLTLVIGLIGAGCAPATPAATTAPAAGTTPAASTFKMAAIFPGVITDADYNTLAYIGLTSVQSDLGVATAYSESVAVPDVDRVMREYIDQGFNIIWTHGGQFINQTVELAKAFPNLVFIGEGDAAVKDPPANLWVIDRNFHTGFYAIGALAGKLTKTGKIGYIAGQTLPFSYAEVHAMQQALKDQNLKVELKTVWTGDFNDPTKARQVADAMIADNVDVLVGSLNLGMFGVFESVKASDKSILVTAKYTDKSSFAPKNVVTSLLYDFKGPMKEIVGKIMKGEKGGYYPLGFATGVALQSPLQNVPTDTQAYIDGIVKDLKDGKITVVKDTTAVK
ncbi:MAG: BMP family protein [Anaerolineaceae bacterium]|nr:BMP family protein [Anaerolineaceae bacterium]